LRKYQFDKNPILFIKQHFYTINFIIDIMQSECIFFSNKNLFKTKNFIWFRGFCQLFSN